MRKIIEIPEKELPLVHASVFTHPSFGLIESQFSALKS